MSFADNPYRATGLSVAESAAEERSTFLVRTYAHLAGAIFFFLALCAALQQTDLPRMFTELLMQTQIMWLVVLGGFMAVSWLANSWAQSDTSRAMQYMGLGLYVVAQTVIFAPLLYIATTYYPNENILVNAGVVTLVLFGGLTAVVFITRKDFSFLRTGLMFAGFAAMALIAAAVLFGFQMGLMFILPMIALACGYILYYTSNVMLHYRTDQYVAASLALFSAVALLFYYVIQLFMSRR